MYSSDLTAFGKKCCYFFVPFWCLVFDIFWCCVLDLVIFSTYFNHVNGAKCLIHINLCTFHVKKNSTRLQWYSCARYKAPGPLVWSQGKCSKSHGILFHMYRNFVWTILISMIGIIMYSLSRFCLSYCSYCMWNEQYKAYDPFLDVNAAQPSNPWISDDTMFWEVSDPA